MENNANWHGVAPKPEECEAALKELGGELDGKNCDKTSLW